VLIYLKKLMGCSELFMGKVLNHSLSVYPTPVHTLRSSADAYSALVSNVSVLEKTAAEVCSWISAYLFMLTPSKTDILLMGLPKHF
jgi:hypothetical protein